MIEGLLRFNAQVGNAAGGKCRRRLLRSQAAVFGFVAIAAFLLPASAQRLANGMPSPGEARAIIQNLYAEQDQAYTNHDIFRIASFVDFSYIFLYPNGKQVHFAEWRKGLSGSFTGVRNSHAKTTVKDVQVKDNTLVASIEWVHSYEVKDQNRPLWVPTILSETQEETWKKIAANWKLIFTKTLREDVFGPVPLSTLIDHDSQLIAFLCSGALTAEERRRITAFAAAEVRRDANVWYKNDVTIRQDLKSIRENPGAISGEVWQKWRWKLALSAADDVEAQIVAAHDPVVVLDRERSVLITEQTIRTLREAVSWVAKQTGRRQPDAQYIANMRNTIRQQWRAWPKETLSSFTNIVQDFPATLEYMLGGMSEDKRKEWFTAWGKELKAEPQSTIRTASNMFFFYNQLIQEKELELVQVTNWSINRMRRMGQRHRCLLDQSASKMPSPWCPPSP